MGSQAKKYPKAGMQGLGLGSLLGGCGWGFRRLRSVKRIHISCYTLRVVAPHLASYVDCGSPGLLRFSRDSSLQLAYANVWTSVGCQGTSSLSWHEFSGLGRGRGRGCTCTGIPSPILQRASCSCASCLPLSAARAASSVPLAL